MIGILILLAVSWAILYLFEKKSLLALGPLPFPQRLNEFILGFIITATLCVAVQTIEQYLRSSNWTLNDNQNLFKTLKMAGWDFISVCTEELVFRGALLYILIQRIGVKTSIAISAISFGVYHWFSYSLLGQIIPMIVIFIGTGLMGYAWALAFAKSRSMLLPIGLHFGWNFTFNTIFSKSPLGGGLILTNNANLIRQEFSLIGMLLVPLIVFLIVNFIIKDQRGQSSVVE